MTSLLSRICPNPRPSPEGSILKIFQVSIQPLLSGSIPVLGDSRKPLTGPPASTLASAVMAAGGYLQTQGWSPPPPAQNPPLVPYSLQAPPDEHLWSLGRYLHLPLHRRMGVRLTPSLIQSSSSPPQRGLTLLKTPPLLLPDSNPSTSFPSQQWHCLESHLLRSPLHAVFPLEEKLHASRILTLSYPRAPESGTGSGIEKNVLNTCWRNTELSQSTQHNTCQIGSAQELLVGKNKNTYLL